MDGWMDGWLSMDIWGNMHERHNMTGRFVPCPGDSLILQKS